MQNFPVYASALSEGLKLVTTGFGGVPRVHEGDGSCSTTAEPQAKK